MKRASKPRTKSYSSSGAGQFWSQRVKSTDQLSAVLSYGAPKELNQLYDQWERQALAGILPVSLNGKQVLDIGAGVGRVSIMLAKFGAEVVSVDISSEMLKRLERNAANSRVSNRITIQQCSSHDMPFADRSFDIVTCFGLLEHLPDEVRTSTVLEAIRSVKRRGRIYMTVNNMENPFLSRNYPMKRQRADGYFVSLVGLEWLRTVCRNAGVSLTVRSANPWYGLVHYHLYPNLKQLHITRAEFTKICSLALKLDSAELLPAHPAHLFASHFLVEIRKRASASG